MRYANNCPPALRRAPQHGYSLIELLVAMVVAVFLLAGLATVLQGTRKTAVNQGSLAQLQDDERVAMTMITNAVEAAGYYPNPESTDISQALPATVHFDIGQVVFGMANTGIQNTTPDFGDVLIVRYNAAANEDVINCQGTSNATKGAPASYTNEFAVLQPDPKSPPYLGCSIDGGQNFVPLVRNVSKLTISYGVNSTSVLGNTIGVPVDSYVPTQSTDPTKPDMPKAVTTNPQQWTNVYSVKVQVTFINPLYQPAPNVPPTPGQLPTVTFTRVIGVMSRIGVDVSSFT
jgi:type IV pilus assembly protein PilW